MSILEEPEATLFDEHSIYSRRGTEKNREIRIHEWLTLAQIEEIRNIFMSHPDQALTYDQLNETLRNYQIFLSEQEYHTFFFKTNINRDDVCNWDEFVSHIIFNFRQDDPHSQKESLIMPIATDPVVKTSKHKTSIIAVTLIQSTQDDGDEECGSYLTASKDGFINFWSAELEITRSGWSKSHYLKYTQTWVLCMTALSDVRVVCISSTERELRFYDVMATNFHLRFVIRSVPFAINSIAYCFTNQEGLNSKLLLGDFGGNVRVLEFSPKLRGPFQSKPGTVLVEFTWSEVLRGKFLGMYVSEHINLFTECIQQMYFSYKLETLYVGAESHSSNIYSCNSGVMGIDSRGTKSLYHIPEGVSCFFFDEKNRILATGGPDAFLRLWDPFVPAKASAVLTGHHAGIVYIFIQPEEKFLYSIDLTKVIKVWHLIDRLVLQTFTDLMVISANETQLFYVYNKAARELLVCGRKLVSIKCCPKLQTEITDGNTHAGPVSVVLYNTLFENVVTCGLDSNILVWDPWTGKRQIIIKKCHTKEIYGEIYNMEITSACFDPMQQLLITGARDGSLKIWSYNNAVCVRNMSIEAGCEVTAIFWVPDRIVAVGWNHRVTEFADVKGLEYTDAKKWVILHDSDIISASYKAGEVLVTGSYSGEMIFWKLETGQAYRKYEVKHPKRFIKLIPGKEQKKEHVDDQHLTMRASKLIRTSISTRFTLAHRSLKNAQSIKIQQVIDRNSSSSSYLDSRNVANSNDLSESIKTNPPKDNDTNIQTPLLLTPKTKPDTSNFHNVKLKLSVQAVMLLCARPMSKEYGSVLVALENGMIQVYSHHQSGGYMDEFNTIHKTGDCVLSMTTDKNNEFLITGTAFGFIKIFLLTNYCVPKSAEKKICMPLLRLQFIFLSHDRIQGRAKRIAGSDSPMLMSSHKAHLRSITSILYLEQPKFIITGSHDFSVRMWSLGGRYIGTFGGLVPWKLLIPNEPLNEQMEYRMPPDVNKIASNTTLKVITGKVTDHLSKFKPVVAENSEIMDTNKSKMDVKTKCKFGKSMKEPLLGRHFRLEPTGKISRPPVLDKSLPYIPVYTHLNVHNAKAVERPSTPEAIKKIKKLDFMVHYKRKK